MRSLLSLFLLTLLPLPLPADTTEDVTRLLGQKTPPFGVVFEIAEEDDDALNWAIPEVKKQIIRLRKKYPTINLAVVSHGYEQFALATDERTEFEDLHGNVESLGKDNVDVHVCGTHASWYGKSDEDFPAYVDVSPAGPAQINDYASLGYVVVRVTEP